MLNCQVANKVVTQGLWNIICSFAPWDLNDGDLKHNLLCPLVTLFKFCSCDLALGFLSLPSFPPLQGVLFDVLAMVSSCQVVYSFVFYNLSSTFCQNFKVAKLQLRLLIMWECEKGRTRHGIWDKSLMLFLKHCLDFSFVFLAPLSTIKNMFSARGIDMPLC
jgi:hypothetical protein